MVWFKYIALIHVAFASEDLAVTLGRPRWHGILVDPPASVSTRVEIAAVGLRPQHPGRLHG